MNNLQIRQSFGPWLVAALLAVAMLGGCGQSGGPDPKIQEKNIARVKNMRFYFDKSGGDYTQLSDAEKADFVKLSGSEALAQQNWNLMKNGPGAGARNAAPSTAGN